MLCGRRGGLANDAQRLFVRADCPPDLATRAFLIWENGSARRGAVYPGAYVCSPHAGALGPWVLTRLICTCIAAAESESAVPGKRLPPSQPRSPTCAQPQGALPSVVRGIHGKRGFRTRFPFPCVFFPSPSFFSCGFLCPASLLFGDDGSVLMMGASHECRRLYVVPLMRAAVLVPCRAASCYCETGPL